MHLTHMFSQTSESGIRTSDLSGSWLTDRGELRSYPFFNEIRRTRYELLYGSGIDLEKTPHPAKKK